MIYSKLIKKKKTDLIFFYLVDLMVLFSVANVSMAIGYLLLRNCCQETIFIKL